MKISEATFRLILFVTGLSILFLVLAGETGAKNAPPPYVPEIIEVPQEHAWCYVLVNSNRAVGNINTLSCVPKEQ